MSNRSQIDRKLIEKYALKNVKNVIACVHFDVVFSGQSPLIDVTFGLCPEKNHILAELSFSFKCSLLGGFAFFWQGQGFKCQVWILPWCHCDVVLWLGWYQFDGGFFNLGYRSSKAHWKYPSHQQKRTLSVYLEFFDRQTIWIGKRLFCKPHALIDVVLMAFCGLSILF